MQIFILGMHRSGTSMLSRILNMMGMYFGEYSDEILGSDFNKKGYWERQDVLSLNDEILKYKKSDWCNIVNFDNTKLTKKQEHKVLSDIRKIIMTMDKHRPWFIKDPRLCLTLPYWLEHCELPLAIRIIRDSSEVAGSLSSRNNFPETFSKSLWHYYNHSMELNSKELPNITLDYNKFFTSPVETVKELYDSLINLGVKGIRLPSDREITSFIDPNLRHNATVDLSKNKDYGVKHLLLSGNYNSSFDMTQHKELVFYSSLKEKNNELKCELEKKTNENHFFMIKNEEMKKSSVNKLVYEEALSYKMRLKEFEDKFYDIDDLDSDLESLLRLEDKGCKKQKMIESLQYLSGESERSIRVKKLEDKVDYLNSTYNDRLVEIENLINFIDKVKRDNEQTVIKKDNEIIELVNNLSSLKKIIEKKSLEYTVKSPIVAISKYKRATFFQRMWRNIYPYSTFNKELNVIIRSDLFDHAFYASQIHNLQCKNRKQFAKHYLVHGGHIPINPSPNVNLIDFCFSHTYECKTGTNPFLFYVIENDGAIND